MDVLSLLIGFLIGLIIMGIVLFIVHSNDKKSLEVATKHLPETFSNMAYQALRDNNQEFHNLSIQAQAPINNAVDQLRQEINAMEMHRQKELGSVIASTNELNKQTQKLNNILNSNKASGAWGETTLERIVELSGMVKYCDFKTQVSADGIRPDMVVTLPNNRVVIIDAKTPLSAYIKAVNCESEEIRNQYLIEHSKNVKDRIKDLSNKKYWEQFNSLDFVVLFIPNEQILSVALINAPDLIEEAMQKNVVIATPTSLFSLLLAIKSGWNENQLTDNAKKIADLGGKLSSSIKTWLENIAKTGNALNIAVSDYNSSVTSLKKNVLPYVDEIKACGFNDSESICLNEIDADAKISL